MEINSKLFGKIEYTDENIINFEEGLIGISDKQHFILVEKDDFKPFSYLQSVDEGSFVLVVINPLMVESDYKFDIYRDDLYSVGLTNNDPESFSLMAIVILAPKLENITVNLKAPVLINIHTKQAKQVILQNDDYGVEEPLLRPTTPVSGPFNFTSDSNK
jgi:flagellar assembly factor FliW